MVLLDTLAFVFWYRNVMQWWGRPRACFADAGSKLEEVTSWLHSETSSWRRGQSGMRWQRWACRCSYSGLVELVQRC